MDRDPVKRLLDDWASVARAARQPERAPRRRSAGAARSTVGLLGAAAAAVAIVIAVGWLGGRIAPGAVGASTAPSAPDVAAASATPSAVASPTGSPSAGPTTVPSPSPSEATPTPTPSPLPAVTACAPGDLAARITAWEGAAGSRIASVEVMNGSAASCSLPSTARPALIDGHRAVLAQGRVTNGSGGSIDVGSIEIAPGGTVTTVVSVSNVCGAPPAPPVTVAFDLGSGALIATPLTSSDATVPPCNGPGQPAVIEMQPWAR